MAAVSSPVVLITGCSSGLGKALMERLAQRSIHVLATARNSDSLPHGQEFITPLSLDLEDSKSVAELARKVRLRGGVDVLVSNAGFQVPGAAEDMTREALRAQFEANFFGTVELVNLILPQMFSRARGRLIFVSSVFGYSALPYRAAYIASKYALEGWVDALRLELSETSVRLSLVQPGPVATDFRRSSGARFGVYFNIEQSRHCKNYQNVTARLSRARRPNWHTLRPERVARVIERIIFSAHPPIRRPVGILAYLLLGIKFLPDRVGDAFLRLISASGRV